jgi:uncharacterized protein DUF6922
MSITIKKIGLREYAYNAYRSGKKVVQKYLGPADAPEVIAQIAAIRNVGTVPSTLFKLFWDVDPKTLDARRHYRYIIERILDYGDMDAFHWAQKQYPSSRIIEVCLTSRRLSNRSRQFWNIWFGVKP